MIARRGRRLSLRTRLTLNYAGIFLLTEFLLLASVYILVLYVPQYRLAVIEAGGQPVNPPKSSPTSGSIELSLEAQNDVLNTLLLAFAGCLLVIGLLGVYASWLMAGRVLRPIDRITRAARTAQEGTLHERIGLSGPQDELKRLADTFDAMLDRLEADVHAHQRFAANAAHELRTPLAATRTMLQVAMAEPDRHDLTELGTRLLSANTRSIATTEALLTLTAARHADIRAAVVDMAEVTREVIDHHDAERVRAEVGIDCRLDSASIDGDPVLIQRLVTNLIANAIRHNHPGGAMTVTTAITEPRHCVLTVSNTGPLVEPRQVRQLFEPFFRGRGRVGRGHGLGLSIVHAITEAHDGTVTAMARPEGGLEVTVRL